MKLRNFYLAGLVIAATIAPLGLAPTSADYFWPDDVTRNSYYMYNPWGGTPYFFTPDNYGKYTSYDGQNRLALNAGQVAINTGSGTVFHIYLDGANADVGATALNQIYNPYPYNSAEYWRWRASGDQSYANVRYNNVYPGTNLTYFNDMLNGNRRLGYDFTINPGYDPRVIKLNLRDAQSVTVDNQGNLVIVLKDGQALRKHLRVFQSYDGELRSIPASYQLLGDRQVGFNVNNYDTARPLFIDPVLSYSPYDNTNYNSYYNRYDDKSSYYNNDRDYPSPSYYKPKTSYRYSN